MAQGQNVEGVGLYHQGNYHAAVQKFTQALEADPKNPDAYYNLAATYHRQGKLYENASDLQQAESLYHQCLDYDPNHQACHRGLVVLLVEQERAEDAFRLLENWREHSPSNPAPRVELARLFEEFGDREAAKAHLIDALAIAPDHPRALAALGKLREESGDTAQALANYQRSLASDRFQPQVAARVAALNTAGPIGPMITPPGGTRLVAVPSGAGR